MQAQAEQFQQIPISALRESALNTRRHYNEARLNDLADSIRTKGIITPLIVRPAPGEKGAFEIAAGHRRYRGAKIAQRETAPAIIRDYNDDEFLEILTVENLQREDVHPMEEAEGYAELLKRPGYDVPTIAAKVGKPDPSYVYQRLKLLDLVKELREDFLGDRFTIAHAINLARLQPADQKSIRQNHLYDRENGVVSIQALRNALDRQVYLDLAKAPFPIHDEKLLAKAGSCDACQKRSGFNQSLFPEVGKRDLCLDRPCYYRKANAQVAAEMARLEKETGKAPPLITPNNEWNTDKGKKLIVEDRYRLLKGKDRCPSAEEAVVSEESLFGGSEVRLGQTVWICRDTKCKTHWGGHLRNGVAPRAQKSTADQIKELDAKEAAEAGQAASEAVLSAVLARITYPLSVEDFRAVVRSVWARLWHDHKVRILARRSRAFAESAAKLTADQLAADIDRMGQNDLAQLLVEMAIGQGGTAARKDIGDDEDGDDVGLLGQLISRARETYKDAGEYARLLVKERYDAKRAALERRAQKARTAVPAPKKNNKPAVPPDAPKPAAPAKKAAAKPATAKKAAKPAAKKPAVKKAAKKAKAKK